MTTTLFGDKKAAIEDRNTVLKLKIIVCGDGVEQLSFFRGLCSAVKAEPIRTIKVNSKHQRTFALQVCTDLTEELITSEDFCSTDAFIILYDSTKFYNLATYCSFINILIGRDDKTVRVIAIKPNSALSPSQSRKRLQLQKNKIPLTSQWGFRHEHVFDKVSPWRVLERTLYGVAQDLLHIEGCEQFQTHTECDDSKFSDTCESFLIQYEAA